MMCLVVFSHIVQGFVGGGLLDRCRATIKKQENDNAAYVILLGSMLPHAIYSEHEM